MSKSRGFPKCSEGFTLIELLVVITVIAILATIGYAVYSGTQASARNTRRQSEIDSLAKNIAARIDPQTGFYLYNSNVMVQDYPDGLADPGPAGYCQSGSWNPTPPNDPPPPVWTGSCPANWGKIGGSDNNPNSTVTRVVPNFPDLTDSVKGWKVCAVLERSNTVFCKSNAEP